MRVALCDDHSLFTEAVASQLESRGHHVVAVVSTPSELVGAVRHALPDAVLLDLWFPSSSGLDGARALRSAGSAVRVVLCTGERVTGPSASSAPAAQTRRALREGWVDAVVLKTADYPQIEEALIGAESGARVPEKGTRRTVRGLTPREVDVLDLVAQGLTTAEVAERLDISTATVHAHVRNAMTRLGARSRFEAVHLHLAAGRTPSRRVRARPLA